MQDLSHLDMSTYLFTMSTISFLASLNQKKMVNKESQRSNLLSHLSITITTPMASINKEASPSNFSSLLPRLFVLKNIADKYLQCESEGDAGRLLFSAKAILYEPRTMFEAEPTSIRGVVHIRCTFNNKYLRRDSESSQLIKALATKKSEDKRQWDCTMFEVLPTKQGRGRIWLRHVQLGYHLGSYVKGLQAINIMPSNAAIFLNFTFIDWSTLVTLPQYVAFKGPNGKYLNANQIGTMNISRLQFRSDDKGEEGVTMKVFPSTDGSFYWMRFRVDSSLCWGRFQVVKDETNCVSFKDLSNNMFCRIKDLQNWPNSYVADSISITQDTKLTIEDAVMRRTLEIEWRLQDARVYNVVPYELNCSTHDNNSSSAVTKSITLTYETTVTTSFETSHTWSPGFKTTIKTPSVPFIGGDMEIEMSVEYGGSYTWGESTTITHSYSETDTYIIPPRTRLVVQKLSTKGYYEVPYNYVQTDYLFNCEVIRTNKEDGVYKGINYFNIRTSNRYEPLSLDRWGEPLLKSLWAKLSS